MRIITLCGASCGNMGFIASEKQMVFRVVHPVKYNNMYGLIRSALLNTQKYCTVGVTWCCYMKTQHFLANTVKYTEFANKLTFNNSTIPLGYSYN